MTEADRAPLEQIFRGGRARVLDHLATMMPFDFSPNELSKILKLSIIEIESILEHLEKYELIEFTKNKKYMLSDNSRTLAVRKFIHEVACWNVEKIIEIQDKHSKSNDTSSKEESKI